MLNKLTHNCVRKHRLSSKFHTTNTRPTPHVGLL